MALLCWRSVVNCWAISLLFLYFCCHYYTKNQVCPQNRNRAIMLVVLAVVFGLIGFIAPFSPLYTTKLNTKRMKTARKVNELFGKQQDQWRLMRDGNDHSRNVDGGGGGSDYPKKRKGNRNWRWRNCFSCFFSSLLSPNYKIEGRQDKRTWTRITVE